MRNHSSKPLFRFFAAVIFGGVFLIAGCESDLFKQQSTAPPAIRDVSAVRLNFKYEADVPPPASSTSQNVQEERNAGVQADFDANRPQELLDLTLSSPDKKHILAVYHRITDIASEYRLDMYTPDGKALKKLTSDTMAVHFPETIVWSPNSASLAFVAMIRVGQGGPGASPTGTPNPFAVPKMQMSANTASETPSDITEPDAGNVSLPTTPEMPAPTGILTFRTEQIYICGADGSGVKPITENEGLIYFYYAWSPDSTMLAALATTAREWKYLDIVADGKGEMMVPVGRPRIIEKNGRERRLDDNITSVHPIWSPDSTKVAAAFDTQIRIYDAGGTNPTQAAIPLRNQLLISSQLYDRNQQRQLQESNAETDANAPAAVPAQPDQPLSMLPDEKLLVSYNPIVEIGWTAEDLIYLKTAYVKRMKNEADSVMSFSRWHRLVLTPQVSTPSK